MASSATTTFSRPNEASLGEDGTDDAGVDAVNAGDDGTDDDEDDEDEAMTNAEKEIVGAASRREGENEEVAEYESVLCNTT